MADDKLKSLETRLNQDEVLRNEFLKDPTKIMKREGVEVTSEMASAIKSQVADLGLAKLGKTAALAKPKISISISIKIKF